MKFNLILDFSNLREKLLIPIMKSFILLFCSLSFGFTSGNLLSQNSKVVISQSREYTVKEVLELFKEQTDYTFIYKSDLFAGVPKTKLKKGIVSANELLERVLVKRDFLVEVNSNNSIIIKELPKEKLPVKIQKIVSGVVTDENKIPLPGVTVMVKGTNKGTSTDIDGKYMMSIPEESPVLVFSYVGYISKEVKVGDKPKVDIQLMPDVSALDAVVVVGYGTSKVKDVTGAVSRISKQEIEKAPMGASIESMLQGKAAGVNVQIQSASPTSPISVVIRGASSLSGNNQPLWVIDGVPQYSALTSGNIANTLYNLNLNDVQSIDILKDASATAVYGSRASNGVVIVTTKKGEGATKPTIEFSSRVGVQIQDFNDYQYFEADTYKYFADAAARERVITLGRFDYFTRLYLDEQAFKNLNSSEFDHTDLRVLDGAYYEGNTNWQKEMTTNPLTVQHDLSLRGGSESVTYYTSFNYKEIEGIVKSGKSELFGGRLNLDARISDKLKFGLNISGSSRDTDDKDYMLSVLKKVRPDIPPFNEDGTIFTEDAYTENPYTTLKNTQLGKGLTFSGTGFMEFDITNALQLKTAFTNNLVNSESLTYKRRGSQFNYNGSRSWNTAKTSINVWENTLTYAKMFSDKHDINALLGYSMEESKSSRYSMYATNFPDDDVLNNFGSAANMVSMDESKGENALVSSFARVHYKFDDRYIISGTVRRDGSSRFGKDKRWGLFPSGAMAWLVTGEKFMQQGKIKDYVSYLKLRASVGLTGSQNLGNFNWVTLVGSTQYNESPAIHPSSIGNPELQWEQTKMVDVGLDFGLFEDRVWGTIGVYNKKSEELIYNYPLPPSSAFSSMYSNVAAMDNKGIEFDIKYDILRKQDSRLTFDFNISSNINKVSKINGVTQELVFPSSYSPFIKVSPGERTGQWFGYQTAGRLFVTAEETIAFQGQNESGGKQYYRNSQETAGDLIVIDQNGDNVINEDDMVKLGTSVPKAFGGFGLTFQHKNFMVNTVFSYAYGHKRLWQMPLDDVGYVGNYNHSNLVAGESAIMKSPHDAHYPRMAQYELGDNSIFSDFYLHNASYLRLNALNVSYRLPERFLENMLLQGVELTFQATNLFTITKYPGFDPQGNWTSSSIGSGMAIDNSIYPSARIYNIGIRVKLQ